MTTTLTCWRRVLYDETARERRSQRHQAEITVDDPMPHRGPMKHCLPYTTSTGFDWSTSGPSSHLNSNNNHLNTGNTSSSDNTSNNNNSSGGRSSGGINSSDSGSSSLYPGSTHEEDLTFDPEVSSTGGGEQSMPARLVFIGAHRVGSTSLIRRFNLGLYKDEYVPEVTKVMRHTKSLKHPRYGHYVTVQFWDVEGSDSRVALQCAHKAHAVAVVFDVTNRTSFEKAQKLLDGVNPRASSVLIGNKVDLHDHRKVSFEEGRLLARIHRLEYIETSARLNYNIDEAFQVLLSSVPDEYLHSINNLAARRWRFVAANTLCAICRQKVDRHMTTSVTSTSRHQHHHHQQHQHREHHDSSASDNYYEDDVHDDIGNGSGEEQEEELLESATTKDHHLPSHHNHSNHHHRRSIQRDVAQQQQQHCTKHPQSANNRAGDSGYFNNHVSNSHQQHHSSSNSKQHHQHHKNSHPHHHQHHQQKQHQHHRKQQQQHHLSSHHLHSQDGGDGWVSRDVGTEVTPGGSLGRHRSYESLKEVVGPPHHKPADHRSTKRERHLSANSTSNNNPSSRHKKNSIYI